MTVYLHCEGVDDHAVIAPLMKKAGQKPDLDIRWIQRDVLKTVRIHRKSGIVISGPYKMIKALAVVSLRQNCKNIACHQDADRNYDVVYKAIDTELDGLRKKGLNCLTIVPKETIESWLLADENAYPAIPKNPALPKNPEELWGDSHDPRSDHPKRYLSRVLEQFHLENNRDTYACLAENSGIKTLQRRCPVSFGQFCADTQTFAAAGMP
ncbi:MAG: hypothetical protein LBK63_03785 [Treponema sp.]|jgi:hypothetical protein|nr:hypothetical protein [Treponema sp.]